jgi:lipopolysaccharide/colanic/teichoic acid biosynthesis glycosyltransferase
VSEIAHSSAALSGLGSSRPTKRLFDIVFAGVGLLLLFPLGVAISLIIKLSDGGPIFYRQRRIGLFGKPFYIWKLRSMVVNADKVGVSVTRQEDPRITTIGRFIRKTKLDELPQLWNVLIGEMSFVGPRPEVPRYVELYTPEQRQILNFKPGITDVATMQFRNEEALLQGTDDVEKFYIQYCLPKKIELNLQYEERAGLLQDFWIILQTLCPYWLGVMLIYGVALTASFWLSYQLRSDFRMSRAEYREFSHCLPWMILPQLILLMWRGQVRGLMSYFSIPEMRRLVTVLAGALILQAGLCLFTQRNATPRLSIFLMDFILSYFALCALRLGLRFLRERSWKTQPKVNVKPLRVAIIGTGEIATNLVLEFARGNNAARKVIAFFDDNPRAWQRRPHDIPVFGMPECLLNPEWQKKIDEVIVALPDADPARLKEIQEMLQTARLKATIATGWLLLRPLEAETFR